VFRTEGGRGKAWNWEALWTKYEGTHSSLGANGKEKKRKSSRTGATKKKKVTPKKIGSNSRKTHLGGEIPWT